MAQFHNVDAYSQCMLDPDFDITISKVSTNATQGNSSETNIILEKRTPETQRVLKRYVIRIVANN